MKWKLAKKSTNVLYQSQVHRVRPKQSLASARAEQLKDAQQLVRIPANDKLADKVYNMRKRIRVGDK